jgi:uncharacterized protein (TIRG00374 family)
MKDYMKVIASVAATAFFLWLALHDVKWSEVWTHFRSANLPLLLASIVIATLGIHVRALRWKALLAPIRADMPFQPRVAGTAAGLALNNLLPARVGEFARVLVCARLGRVKIGSVLGTIVVERVLDAMVLLSVLFGVLAFEGFPGTSNGVAIARGTARGATIAAAVLGAAMLVLTIFPAPSVRFAEAVSTRVLPVRMRRPLIDALHAFLGGLGALRDPRLLAQSVAWAVGQWLFLGTSFLLGFWAFGIREPGYAGALFVQSLVSMAAALPAAPGFWGPFELASKLGLGLWGVDESRAVAFAIAFHMGGWLGVTGVGLYYISKLNLSWNELKGSVEKVETAVEDDPELTPGAGVRGA